MIRSYSNRLNLYIFQFIIGFRKEQVNVNLLNGKGEISNVEINCSFLNSNLSKLSPFVELERVHISKISFHVSSWANLRKAPIIVDIEDIEASILEPLHCLDETERKKILQVFHSQLPALLKQGLVSKRGPYNLFDRILDNLSFEVRSAVINFTTWGKFKTRRVGPWTPPRIQVKLAGARMVSVNEYGQEAAPDEVWRHNHNQHAFLIYKKIEISDYQLYLIPHDDIMAEPIPLLGQDNKLVVQLAIMRRVKDGETLSVQLDVTIPKMEVDIQAHVLPQLHAAVKAVTFLLAKDRRFEDPLKRKTTGENDAHDDPKSDVRVIYSRNESAISESGSAAAMGQVETSVPLEEDVSSSSSEDEIETKSTTSSDAGVTPGTAVPISNRPLTSALPLPTDQNDRPLIVMPMGLCIHDKISFSLSIHHLTVEGTYAGAPNKSSDCHIQLVSRGLIAEMIWPKVDETKGGYVQASIGYFRVMERFKSRVRTLMVGGAEHDSRGPLSAALKRPEVGIDESFPLYEDRSIRLDPSGLRYTFPTQAFGLKTTVDFLSKDQNDTMAIEADEDIKVTHEIGVDQLDIVLDCQSWARIVTFALNVPGGGYDARVDSGDWSSFITQDMLKHPDIPLNLEACIQPVKELMLDDNDFLSSDLFNVTARIMNTGIRFPAAILDDIRSCDIAMILREVTFVVSSALPRTFISGRIGSSVNGEDATDKGIIDFPNDPSDVAYLLESTEDPSNRQRGVQTSKISTFRLQTTLRGATVRFVPVISIPSTKESQQLLGIDELTMIFCFEGEPPEDQDSNLTKLAMFISIETHRLGIGLDLELATSALGTLAYHSKIVNQALDDCRCASACDELEEPTEVSVLSQSSDRPTRRVIVQRQIQKSRQTGGFSLSLCVKVAELDFSLWRQNIQYSSPFRVHSALCGTSHHTGESPYLPLLRLMSVEMREGEMGFEVAFVRLERRMVTKVAITETCVHACDFKALLVSPNVWKSKAVRGDGMFEYDSSCIPSREILRVGRREGGSATSTSTDDNGLVLRAEEQSGSHRLWALGCDVGNVVVDCQIDAVESLVLLTFEALLMPAWSKASIDRGVGSWRFPEGSVGALLHSTLSGLVLYVDDDNNSVSNVAKDTEPPDEVHHTVPTTIDAMLRNIIWKVVPKDVEVVLLRYTGRRQIVKVPTVSETSPPFGLLLEQTELVASYLATSGLTSSRLLNVLGARGFSWQTIVQSMDCGLRHKMHSSQQVISCLSDQSADQLDTTLVESFDIGYIYDASKVVMSLGKNIVVDQVNRLDDFLTCLNGFGVRCRDLKKNVNDVVFACRRAVEPANSISSASRVVCKDENPSSLACQAAVEAIRSAKAFIRSANEKVSIRADFIKDKILSKDTEIARLRYLVFEKERERLSVLALAWSNVSGWLHLGSSQRTGQRGLMTWNLSAKWCVLRGDLLFVYSSPGQFRPLDSILLKGSSLRQLAGGRKHDLKRAFALVESTGVVHLIATRTDHEFYLWVQNFNRIIGTTTSEQMALQQLNMTMKSSKLDASPHSVNADGTEYSTHQPRFGRFAQAIHQAAKSTSQSIAERRRQKLEESNIEDQGFQNCEGEEYDSTAPNENECIVSTESTEQSGAIFEMSIPGRSIINVAARASEHIVTDVKHHDSRDGNDDNVTESQTTAEFMETSIVSTSRASSVHTQGSETSSQGNPEKRLADDGRRLRNRFASVRMATKNRVGSAIVAAKEKSRKVVADVRSRGNTGESNEALSTVDIGGADDSVWACPACTFHNAVDAKTCQICQHIKEFSIFTSTTDEGTTLPVDIAEVENGYQKMDMHQDDQTNGDEISELGYEDDPRSSRRGVKDRIGAAMMSIRRSNQDSSFDDGAARGSRSWRQSNTANIGAPEGVKLRGVGLAGPLPPARFVDPIQNALLPPADLLFKRLDYTWTIKVDVQDEKYFEANGPIRGQADSEENESEAEDVETTTGYGDNRSMQKLDELLGLTISIQVFNKDGLPGPDPPDVHAPPKTILKQLHEVLALHSGISECLSSFLPYINEVGGNSSDMAPDTQEVSCLDCVRLSGKILSGILDLASRRDSQSLQPYCGKFLP